MSTMEDLLSNQQQITGGINTLLSNFKKDGPDRKTSDYIKRRVEMLDGYWQEFQSNHVQLNQSPDQSHQYFVNNHYQQTYELYISAREKILQTPTTSIIRAATPLASKGTDLKEKMLQPPTTSTSRPSTPITGKNIDFPMGDSTMKSQGVNSRLDELIKKQISNFKAFTRTVQNINSNVITEKWEFEDSLKKLESRWAVIDAVHWELDSILDGSNDQYEITFTEHEQTYNNTKKSLNSKLWSMTHREKATPHMDIPIFHGNPHQWVSFKDLFTETIHNNSFLSNAQKMQFLKSKVKGEAERLIQHLNISSDNYIICWDILNHRFNNKKLIFTSHINILLNFSGVQSSSFNNIKRMHDVTQETLNAIKSLGVNTSSWDPLLVHILCQKLDSDTHNEYISSLKQPRELPTLSEFLKFLEGKFMSIESSRRKQETNFHHKSNQQVAKSTNNCNNTKLFPAKVSYSSNKDMPKATSNNKFHSHRSCPVCKSEHGLYHCKQFLEMPPANKKQCILKHNLCQNCLYDHYGKDCFSTKRCQECNGFHNTILHEVFKQSNFNNQGNKISSFKQQSDANSHVAQQYEMPEILLSTAMVKVQKTDGSYQTMRVLIDMGSQVSIISENAAQQLALPRRKCKGIISGIGAKDNSCKGVMNINCTSVINNYQFSTDVYIMKNLIKHLPNNSFPKPSWDYLNFIQLADPEFNICRPVDILLGADVYPNIVLEGICRSEQSSLIAQQTRLGWILCGNIKTMQCNVIQINIDEIQRFWEMEDVSEEPLHSSEALECLQLYQSTTERLKDGRYQVKLPLKPNWEEELGQSKSKAVAQFRQQERKLSNKVHILNEYKSFINEYRMLGHMQLSKSSTNTTKECYLPHHSVLRDSTSTSLRVVFNASAKTSSGKSLNDLMLKGPNLQQDLQTLILKWRQYKVAFTADIEKMFRQIWVHADDQKLQKIIWRDSPRNMLQEYQLTTVTYGTKAAPFLAMMTLRQLANDERENYPEASKVVEEAFYMDDLVHGTHTIKEARILKEDLIAMLKRGGFNLRKWSSNDPRLLQLDNEEPKIKDFKQAESAKTLGLSWNPTEDKFSFSSTIEPSNGKVTKRIILSDITKIFDPLGWLTPITTKLKILFQEVWLSKIDWDDEVPENIHKNWIKIKLDLQDINQLKVPRWIGTILSCRVELHGYCDSSKNAYACVIYCKINNGETPPEIILVAAKSRLVPSSKIISLPRLELCGAVLLSKLMAKVVKCLSGYNIKVYGWCDSTAVLGWIHGDPGRWKTFVANRTCQITSIMPSNCWKYLKSTENPADVASRGSSVAQLKNNPLWCQGPSWLATYMPEKDVNKDIYVTEEEIKKQKQSNVVTKQEESVISNLLSKHSSISKITHILAWVYRFISKNKQKGSLTLSELSKAKEIITKHEQEKEYAEEICCLKQKNKLNTKSKILKLNPFLDENSGLLRVRGRLQHAHHISQDMQHPIILPHSGRLTELIINDAHAAMLHGGARLTLSFIRQKYWIVGGYRATKAQIRRCVKCAKHNPILEQQIMGDLPEARSNPSRPFKNTGVDFTGHIFVKASKGRGIRSTKGYVAVFVCMATKAVHLELVSDLSTPSFIAALRRMAARKGAPSHCYSDNGRNFVGANKILQQEYQEILKTLNSSEVRAEMLSMEIQWHFSVPFWPTGGGIWEAAVKSCKNLLKKTIGEQILTYEELYTVLTQIEGCLNSRPLCPISEDPDDMDFLTPAHFLTGGANVTLLETETDHRTRWQLTQKIVQDLWKRWRHEYLTQLSVRSKWRQSKENIKLNDVVIIHDANLPPGKWLMGRVIKLHPGSDSYVRVITLKTKNGELKRPITKVSILPVHEQNHEQKTPETNQSQSKQTSSIPRFKLSTMFTSIILFLSIITSSQCTLNATTFRDNQHLYFDKVSNMNIIRDEWKLIIYYKMQPYWEGTTALNKSITTLERACQEIHNITYCNLILLQLRHELNELDYHNQLLLNQQDSTSRRRERRRTRRGLINGVGYLGNYLFGILDSRFAEQYGKDITLLRDNQRHVMTLWKKQTSVMEAELNLLKRVEKVVSEQHKIIRQKLYDIEKTVEFLKSDIEITSEFTMGALITSNLLQNLKHLQRILIDTITDIYHGRFNPYLINPKQLQDQLSSISSHLSSDVTLPIENIHIDISRIFKLITTKARMIPDYLIFELRIPLISRDSFEIFKIIPIPEARQDSMINIKPISDYIAINLKKDTYLTLSENGIRSCLAGDTYLCHINKPSYRIVADTDFCQKKETACETVISPCKNIWMESHSLNNYIYFCCKQCQLRIMCGSQVTSHQLTRAGLVNINSGCIIKTDTFEIIAHDLPSSEISVTSDIYTPVIAPINHIINVSIPHNNVEPNNTERSSIQEDIDKIDKQIKTINENASLASSISYHDIHHYTVIYVIIGVSVIGGAVWWGVRGRRTWSVRLPAVAPAAPEPAPAAAPHPAPAPRPLPAAPDIDHCVSVSARISEGTSPIITSRRSQMF